MRSHKDWIRPNRFIAAATLAVFFLFGIELFAQEPAAETNDTSHLPSVAATRFFKFLSDPQPAITRAVFEKELAIENLQKDLTDKTIPTATHKQFFSLTADGENYVLGMFADSNRTAIAGSTGAYQKKAWNVLDGSFTSADPAINSKTNLLTAEESVTRLTANLFINLGITELVRDSLAPGKKKNQFFARATDGERLTLDFKMEPTSVAPSRVIIGNGPVGIPIAYIDYDYSTNLTNGELPSSFTRHNCAFTNDLGWVFKVQVFELTPSPDHLAPAALDPVQLFKPQYTAFYSNDILYNLTKSGRAEKILTTEEFQKTIPKGDHHTGTKIFAATVIVVGVAVFVWSLFSKPKAKPVRRRM